MGEIRTFHPADISQKNWRQLQDVARQACEASFGEQYDVEQYVGWDDPERFFESHRDPNTEVGHRYNANQEYAKPLVAVAYDAYQPVGWFYAADNVSGGGSPAGPHNTSMAARLEREAKRLSVVRNYRWLREVYVLDNYRRQGLGAELAYQALRSARPSQPVGAYAFDITYKDGQISVVDWAKRNGLQEAGRRTVEAPGLGEAEMLFLKSTVRIVRDRPRPAAPRR